MSKNKKSAIILPLIGLFLIIGGRIFFSQQRKISENSQNYAISSLVNYKENNSSATYEVTMGNDSLFIESLRQLKIGDDKEQVFEILGTPSSIVSDDSDVNTFVEILLYNNSSIVVENGKIVDIYED